LVYNWNRYYDFELGRYVTPDPIGLGGGLNTYGYVYGNPLIMSDFNGLQVKGRWMKKNMPSIYDYTVLKQDVRRPPDWYKFWNHFFTYRAMEVGVSVDIGYDWSVRCTEECGDSWDVGASYNEQRKVYLPIFTPMHPKHAKYNWFVINPSRLLLAPILDERLKVLTQAASMFYTEMSATKICEIYPRGLSIGISK